MSADEHIMRVLEDEIGLDSIEARVFLFVTTHGRSSIPEISSGLGIGEEQAIHACRSIEGLGGFISMPHDTYEAMHPRFTAVNMYRRYCQRKDMPFKRNNAVDGIGSMLEGRYDDARTK